MVADSIFPPLYLAPMAEFTSPPMRIICERFGAQRTYTEMVNAEGICRCSEKTLFLLETFDEERHVWAHLYGHDPLRLAEAAKIVADMGRFDGIDLNAGCPVPRITAQGAGAALLHDLPRMEAIVRAMSRAVTLPISVKTRLGPNPQVPVWREIIKRMEDAGACSITFHARYTSQGHSGLVHLDTLKEIVNATSLPIFGNGSIVDAHSATAMARTGVRALLIARAALENPAIFSFSKVNPLELAEQHLNLEFRYRVKAQSFSRLTAEEASVLTFRRHLFRYFKGLPGANTLRGNLMNLHSLSDIRHAIEGFKDID